MTEYYSLLTHRGKALEALAAASGTPVVLKDFVVGDGNGETVMPDPEQTRLVNEVYRGTISSLVVSPEQESQFIAYLTLPADTGGFIVREVGLLTKQGELYAVANCAAIEKPQRGVSVNMQFRLAVSETAEIELNVATGDGLFLRQDANLSDLKDKGKGRENLGLGELATQSINFIYPVGIVLWFAQNKNPNTLFPGTTWNYIGENRTVRLAKQDGTDVMSTGGADSVTLKAANLPAHSHTFSANTSVFDYGTKATSGVGDHTHSAWTDVQGNHVHKIRYTGSADGTSNEYSLPANGRNSAETTGTYAMDASGAHAHGVGIDKAGAHSHTVAIGAHSHSISGSTTNVGSGAGISVVNAFITLMGWYRSA